MAVHLCSHKIWNLNVHNFTSPVFSVEPGVWRDRESSDSPLSSQICLSHHSSPQIILNIVKFSVNFTHLQNAQGTKISRWQMAVSNNELMSGSSGAQGNRCWQLDTIDGLRSLRYNNSILFSGQTSELRPRSIYINLFNLLKCWPLWNSYDATFSQFLSSLAISLYIIISCTKSTITMLLKISLHD